MIRLASPPHSFASARNQAPDQEHPQQQRSSFAVGFGSGLMIEEPLMLFQEDSTGHVYAFEIDQDRRPGPIIGDGATFRDDNLIWHPRRGFAP